MQTEVIDVKFNNAGKAIMYCPGDLILHKGDEVVVPSQRGLEVATVVKEGRQVEQNDYDEPIKYVLRLATNQDKQKMADLAKRGRQIRKETQKMADDGKLEMNIVSADFSLDETKITISFTAENRVDFRELVRDLGAKYRTRIELKQIGSRDEVKELGGLGPCGKVCCCKDFLQDFERVSIKMPKVQGLSLNPTKISGLCGRLMCCLAYENKHYSETFRQMPRINSEVGTPKGKGTVVFNNLLKREVQVRIGEKGETGTEFCVFPLSEIKFTQKNTVGFDDDPGDKFGDIE